MGAEFLECILFYTHILYYQEPNDKGEVHRDPVESTSRISILNVFRIASLIEMQRRDIG